MYEKCLFFSLNALTRLVNKHWEDEFAKLGLSAAHGYLVGLVLADRDLSLKEIAERLELAPSTVTRFVDALEKKGLLKRVVSSEDARSVKIHPTKKAEDLSKDLDKAIGRLTGLLVDKLGGKQVDELVKTLQGTRKKFGGEQVTE